MFQLISVIIPIYNNQKYLKKCLDSILNQTYKNLEIICIDDCSSDSSYEILQDYKKRDSRLKIIKNNENFGAGKTKNLGLELAKGEYVFFIDSDDYIELNTLGILVNRALEIDADFIGYNLVRLNESTLEESFSKAENFNDKYFQSMSACTKLYKRLFLLKNKIKFDPIRSAEDMIMAFKVFALAQRYDWLDFDGYFYLQRNGSLTKKKTKEKDDLILKDIFIALNNIKSFLKKISANTKTNFLRKKFNEIEQDYIFYHYNTRHDLNKNDFIINCKLYFDKDINSFNKINDRIIMHNKKEKELNELSTKLSNQIDHLNNKKIIIYGFNDLGKIIFQNYKNIVISIIDQNKFGSYYKDIMIQSIDEIKSIKDVIFVITAINENFIDEIQNNINLKFPQAQIINIIKNIKYD